jgi:hypothetical protein
VVIPLLIGAPGGLSAADDHNLANDQLQSTEKQKVAYDVEQLNRDKILITNQVFRQIFEPYLNPSSPIFITSDTVLSAFHSLFRHSIADMEQINAKRALDILRLIWSKIAPEEEIKKSSDDQSEAEAEGKAEVKEAGENRKETFIEDEEQNVTRLLNAARRRAQIVIAVAVRLLGDTDINFGEHLNVIVENEVNNIVLGEGIKMPEWTGVSDSEFLTVDYSIYRPYGLYAQTEMLRRYFRVLTWFQSIPFRVENDEELLAILILGKTLNASYGQDFLEHKKIEKFFRYYRELTGTPHDWDLLFASEIARDRPGDLEQFRKYLVKQVAGSKPRIKADDRFEPVEDHSTAANFKIISPFGKPDTILFSQMVDFPQGRRIWPGGLGLCAALGSKFAREQLLSDVIKDGKKPHDAINDFKTMIETDSLYNRYLSCLTALIDDAEHDSSTFMSSEPWMVKSCNTVLSGWAKFKNAKGFQTGETTLYRGEASGDFTAGFVEAEPEFFERLGNFVEDVMNLFERNGAFISPNRIIARDLQILADLIENNKYPQPDGSLTDLSAGEISAIKRSIVSLGTLANINFKPEDFAGSRKEIISKILSFAHDIGNGRYDDEPDYHAFILETNIDTKRLWISLRHMCHRLLVLAHKQLRGVNFSKRDNYFLTDFGEKLAAVMLYNVYRYNGSNNEVPHIFPVYFNPVKNTYHYSGTGRPRLMYVLYPNKGEEILCIGAVTPYYEFVSSTALTDQQWEMGLDSDESPQSPVWLKSIMETSAY